MGAGARGGDIAARAEAGAELEARIGGARPGAVRGGAGHDALKRARGRVVAREGRDGGDGGDARGRGARVDGGGLVDGEEGGGRGDATRGSLLAVLVLAHRRRRGVGARALEKRLVARVDGVGADRAVRDATHGVETRAVGPGMADSDARALSSRNGREETSPREKCAPPGRAARSAVKPRARERCAPLTR